MMIPLEYMPPLMFAGLVLFMLFGYPVSFSLSAVGLFFGFFAIEWGFFHPSFLQAIPGRIFGSILSNDLLLAIPFFTFMGTILERCGLAEDMLDSMGQLFGTVRGGLGYSVIIVGFILGAVTGTVAAQVIAMTLISLPVMMRYKYNMRYATGVLAASGTITQLVPPSLVLVVLADQLGKSVWRCRTSWCPERGKSARPTARCRPGISSKAANRAGSSLPAESPADNAA
jgi:TRAP-type mannitol/chloroaromatic compound transport system permease large subunit